MINRRRFLLSGVAAAGVAASRRALGQIRSPNDAVGLGFIGVGWRGGTLLDSFIRLPDARIVALCDPDQERLNNLTMASEETRERLATTPRFEDMRRLIECPDVDAVVIATPNHWHCLAAIWACAAGKDVYVEKPLGQNLWEQRQLLKAARRYNRIVQVGTQQRSSPIQAQAKRWMHDEQLIGEPQRVVVSRIGAREPIGKRTEPLVPPPSLDYGLWLGPAEDKPIFRNQLHYDWHWDYNTGNGEMGNWGVHIIDDVLNVALQDKAGWPTSVASAGTRAIWEDAGDTPNVQVAHFENSVMPVSFILSNITPAAPLKEAANYQGYQTGYTVYAEGGRYEGTRGRGRFLDREGEVIKELKGNSGACHEEGFLQAVKSRNEAELSATLEIAHLSTGWCHLAAIAALEGRAEGQRASAEPKGFASLMDGYTAQIAEWEEPAPVSSSGAIKVDRDTGEIASLAATASQRLVRRDYRSRQWEREFES